MLLIPVAVRARVRGHRFVTCQRGHRFVTCHKVGAIGVTVAGPSAQ